MHTHAPRAMFKVKNSDPRYHRDPTNDRWRSPPKTYVNDLTRDRYTFGRIAESDSTMTSISSGTISTLQSFTPRRHKVLAKTAVLESTTCPESTSSPITSAAAVGVGELELELVDVKYLSDWALDRTRSRVIRTIDGTKARSMSLTRFDWIG